MKPRSFRAASALSFLISLIWIGSASLGAQTHFASVTGTITGSDGLSIPDVEVVATNEATQVKYTAKSNDQGLYTISALPLGTYVVRAQAPQFRPFETNPIKLESGQIARVDITLAVGAAERVEVTAVSPILQTQNAVVGEVISGTTIDRVPLNGRNFSQLSLLLPGVITTEPDSFTQPKNFGAGRPFVNGQREQENNYTLDGVDMNEPIDNLLPYQPSPDALAEVRVETNNYSAEFGNVAGAVIGSAIKSGTNQYKGNAFEYWRDSSMAANSWENNKANAKKAELSQHIFGGTFGGPIIRNRMFFFGDYQTFKRDRPSELVRTVAPAAWRQGDFSGVDVVIRDPVTGQPFTGNQIPTSRFSSIARAVLANQNLYPLPNRPGNSSNLVAPNSERQRAYQGDVKIDANLSDKDRLFGRFSYQKYKSEPDRAPLESNLIATNDSPFLGLAFNWGRTLGPTTLNELLVGFTHVKFQTIPVDWAGIGNANQSVGIPGGQTIPGLSAFNIGVDLGFGDSGGSEFNDIKTYQITEKFSWFKGRHSMKFGGRWLYQNQGFAYSGNEGILGHFNYSGTFTGFAFSDFLLDLVALKGRGGLVSPFTHLGQRSAIYAQDDFRVRKDLTLNLGLTWEYTSPWVEKDDRQSNIDLKTGQLLLAGKNGNSRALYNAYYGGWEPRVGFAWTPTDEWVVRGAYGIVQYMEGTGKNLRLPANPPFNFEGQRTFDQTTGPGSASVGFADIISGINGGPGTLYRIFAPNLRPQLTKQWNIFFERKLTTSLSGQIGYVGSRSSHMVVPFDFNQPEPDPGPVSTWRPLDQRRPLYALNPNIGTTSGTNSIGVGAYDALQASVRERPTDGLEFLASYTYGKALSDNVGYYGVGWSQTAGQGYYYLDSSNPLRDYGPSPYDMRHVFSFTANYDLPFGKGRQHGADWNAAQNAALGGWTLNTIFQAHTGLPITVYDGAGKSLQATRSLERPNRTCNGKINGAGVDDAWIDIKCFEHAPEGQFGNSGVGILYGPGYWNVDFGLAKNFAIDDERYVTFRVEAFNLFNHPNFAIQAGSADMSSPTTFGRIQNTFSAPRIVELVLKFTF
jgi:Carboxypeptidase regulatory-like domain/TonB dependent receptor